MRLFFKLDLQQHRHHQQEVTKFSTFWINDSQFGDHDGLGELGERKTLNIVNHIMLLLQQTIFFSKKKISTTLSNFYVGILLTEGIYRKSTLVSDSFTITIKLSILRIPRLKIQFCPSLDGLEKFSSAGYQNRDTFNERNVQKREVFWDFTKRSFLPEERFISRHLPITVGNGIVRLLRESKFLRKIMPQCDI